MNQQQPSPESFDQKSGPQPEPSELGALVTWGQSLAAMLGALSRLAGAELQLALGDLKRLLAVGVLVIPVSVFAWLGVSVLIGWWCYVLSGSVSLGLLGFIGAQGLIMALAVVMLRRFSASIRLPHTRAQMQAIMRDFEKKQDMEKKQDLENTPDFENTRDRDNGGQKKEAQRDTAG